MRNVSTFSAERSSILVVEDEFLIALSLQNALEDAGYQVLGPATSVNEALELLKIHRPSAAVLDINLRGEFVTPVAHVLEALGVPFVMASAYAPNAAMLDHVFSTVPLLDKPVRDEQLLHILGSVLNGAPSAEQRAAV